MRQLRSQGGAAAKGNPELDSGRRGSEGAFRYAIDLRRINPPAASNAQLLEYDSGLLPINDWPAIDQIVAEVQPIPHRQISGVIARQFRGRMSTPFAMVDQDPLLRRSSSAGPGKQRLHARHPVLGSRLHSTGWSPRMSAQDRARGSDPISAGIADRFEPRLSAIPRRMCTAPVRALGLQSSCSGSAAESWTWAG